MKKNEYVGVFDIKESDTFRPTLESRIHLDSPVSKTLTCREDSCGVIERERERVDSESENSLRENVSALWVSMMTHLILLKVNSQITISIILPETQSSVLLSHTYV